MFIEVHIFLLLVNTALGLIGSWVVANWLTSFFSRFGFFLAAFEKKHDDKANDT